MGIGLGDSRISFKVVICKAIEFLFYHRHTLGNDGAKIRVFLQYDKKQFYNYAKSLKTNIIEL